MREQLGISGTGCEVQLYGHVMRMDEDRCVKKCQISYYRGNRKAWDVVVMYGFRTLSLTRGNDL